MKKPLIIIIILVVLGAVVWTMRGNDSAPSSATDTPGSETTVSVPVSETTRINDKLTEYKNEELGFSVKYPSTWEKITSDSGVAFEIPIGKPETNTIGKLEAKITVNAGKCAFPPVTTVKDRTPLKVGTFTFNHMLISNSVQGRDYFDRMYSVQREGVCYYFAFSSITLNPASKGFKGSEATQMSNNNKALVESADQAFQEVVKSFAYVIGEAGKDETQVVPAKR